MNRNWKRAVLVFALTVAAITVPAAVSDPPVTTDSAETVLVTFHVGSRNEQAFLAALRAERAYLESAHDLADHTPYLLVRGADPAGQTYFVESFTWRDSSVPDHAPAELRAIWDTLNRLCPSVGQRPGIEIAEVEILASK